MELKMKRIYESPEETDGFRILVDRLWPRGVKKEAAQLDAWLKDSAPSPDLRKWFAHDPDKFAAFKERYKESITLFWSPWGSKDSGCSKIKIAKVKACCYSTFTLAIYCFMDFATNVKKKRKSAPYC